MIYNIIIYGHILIYTLMAFIDSNRIFLEPFKTALGEANMALDWGTMEGIYFIEPPQEMGKTYELRIQKITVKVVASGLFGGGFATMSELTNGLQMAFIDKEDNRENLLPAAIKKDTDWAGLSYDVDIKSRGVGNEYLTGRWQNDKVPIIIKNGEKLAWIITDDLSSLDEAIITIEGEFKRIPYIE